MERIDRSQLDRLTEAVVLDVNRGLAEADAVLRRHGGSLMLGESKRMTVRLGNFRHDLARHGYWLGPPPVHNWEAEVTLRVRFAPTLRESPGEDTEPRTPDGSLEP